MKFHAAGGSMRGDHGLVAGTRQTALRRVACALVALATHGNAQAGALGGAPVAAPGEPITGTWLLLGPSSKDRDDAANAPRVAFPLGFLSIDADGQYRMLLACNTPAVSPLDGYVAACSRDAPGAYAHSGRLYSSASRIDFQVDRSTVSTLQGFALSTAYALHGSYLTLTFDSLRQEASAGLQGTVVWQRLPGSPQAVPFREGCGRPSPAPDLDRSAFYEARVDQ